MSRRTARLIWLGLHWPRQVTAEQVVAAFRLLSSLAATPIVVEAIGYSDHVDHRLGLDASHVPLVTGQLRSAFPGLGVVVATTDDRTPAPLNYALRLSVNTRRRPVRTDEPEQVCRALLTALTQVRPKERLVLHWLLGPGLSPTVVPNRLASQHPESWTKALLAAPWLAPSPVDSEARSALRSKQTEPGWRVVGRIGVSASCRRSSKPALSAHRKSRSRTCPVGRLATLP